MNDFLTIFKVMVKMNNQICLIAKFTAGITAVCLIIGFVPVLLFPKALFPDNTHIQQTLNDQFMTHIYGLVFLPIVLFFFGAFLATRNQP